MIVIAGKNNVAVFCLNYLVYSLGLPMSSLAFVSNSTDNQIDGWQMSFKKRALQIGIRELTLLEAEKEAEIFISLEFDKIIKPNNFKTNKLFNIHFSELPKYKGMYTSVWPILYGEKQSASTLHYIDNGIDTGEVIAQDIFAIFPDDCAKDLYLKYTDSAIKLLHKYLPDICKNIYLDSRAQESYEASYFSKKSLDFSNLKIDYNSTAWQIGRQIRAFTFRDYQLPLYGEVPIVNFKIHSSSSTLKPGTVISQNSDEIIISTIDYDMSLFKDNYLEFFDAVASNNLSKVIKMSKSIVNLNDRSCQSWTPLMVASYNGAIDVVSWLIERGADVNAKNFKHTSVLMYAKDYCLTSGSNDIFTLLINSGADLYAKDLSGRQLDSYISHKDLIFLTNG